MTQDKKLTLRERVQQILVSLYKMAYEDGTRLGRWSEEDTQDHLDDIIRAVTDIDINEVAEVAVDKIIDIVSTGYLTLHTKEQIAQAIAKAGVLKWKERSYEPRQE